jgi:hypothetical protein
VAVLFSGMERAIMTYTCVVDGRKRIAPIDMGAGELSSPYVIRIFRQFGFMDQEIDELLANR